MVVKTSHFKVDNGDMMLVELESGRKILVDINIRSAADDDDDDTPNVAEQLRGMLDRDGEDRLYVDAFLNTHPDGDHIRGLEKHFHLGEPSSWSKEDGDKIIIREMWSSPIVFRRATKKDADHTLGSDAEAWGKEARRRVKKFRQDGYLDDGNRILILGQDIDGKTDNLAAILIEVDAKFSRICGQTDQSFEALLIAPLHTEDDEEEEVLTKNNSSVVLRLDLRVAQETKASYLLGGDAEVAIWDRIWDRSKQEAARLEYDVLIAPHHCSWRSLSWDSWSDKGEEAKVSASARKALEQARSGALIIASSKPIKDDRDDPPCIRAKREYLDILDSVNGDFRCVSDSPGDSPLHIEVSSSGPRVKRAAIAATVLGGTATGVGSQPLAHG